MRQFLLASVPALFALAAPAPVLAQSTGEAVSDGEMVVTARRREEAMIDVPGAVSSISADDQQNFVIDNTADILRQLPSATLVNGGPAYSNEISLRGQGGGRVGFSESAVGVYRDGHYIAGGGFGGRGFNRLDLFDLQRIEVLRGPQGALYGRNAVGGAVNAVARRPGHEFGFEGSIGYNDIERTELEAIFNLPITQDAAFRIGGFWHDQRGGFVTQASTGETIDVEETSGARAVFELTPTNDTTIRVTYEYFDNLAPSFGINGYRALRFNSTPLDPSPFVRDLDRLGYASVVENSGYLDVEHDLGWANFDLRASFKVRDAGRTNDDLDHYLGFQGLTSVFPPATPAQPYDLISTQLEDFNRAGIIGTLTSPASSNFSWLVGVEYQQNHSAVDTDASGFAGSPAGLRAQLRLDTSVEELESWALFGAVEYNLTERLALGLEARVQVDDKTFAFDRTRNQPESLAVEILGVRLSESWTRVLPTATLRYNFSDAAAIYGRIALGYRPGGFNVGIPSDIPGAGNLIPYDPETATSYELGFKTRFWDNRLSLEGAVFYVETDDVQIVTAASTTNTSFILQNGTGTEILGAELEARGRVDIFGGRLTAGLGLSTSDGEFQDGTIAIVGGVPVDISGNRVNRTRDLIGTVNLLYRHALVNGLDGFISTSYQTQLGGFENAENSREFEEFSLVDARIGIENDNWRFSIYGKNLTDEVYVIQTISSNVFFNDPQTFGAELSFRY
ncbi:MAG: TonB-dependent receptor [Hyphomonadaceae bacterium]